VLNPYKALGVVIAREAIPFTGQLPWWGLLRYARNDKLLDSFLMPIRYRLISPIKVNRRGRGRQKKPVDRMRPTVMTIRGIIARIRMMASNRNIVAMRVRTGMTAYPVTVVRGRMVARASVMGVGSLG
jgi:hypothetical protein